MNRNQEVPRHRSGCRAHRDCLTCPFPRCREEVAAPTFARWVRLRMEGKDYRRELGRHG